MFEFVYSFSAVHYNRPLINRLCLVWAIIPGILHELFCCGEFGISSASDLCHPQNSDYIFIGLKLGSWAKFYCSVSPS